MSDETSRKEVDLWLVYRDFGVRERIAVDDIPNLGRDLAATIPRDPAMRAGALAMLLAGVKSTLKHGVQQIDKGVSERMIEVASLFVDDETLQTARREPGCDMIRVVVLDTAQLRHSFMVPDLKIGAYRTIDLPPLPPINIWLDYGSGKTRLPPWR